MAPVKNEGIENFSQELTSSFDDVVKAMRHCAEVVSSFTKFVRTLPPDEFAEAIGLDTNSVVSQTAAAGKRKRKVREKKDPNQPKRPTSAYLLFQNEVRKFYQDKMSGQPYSEVMAEISKQWKELPEEKKNIYKQKVEAEKVVYGEKMREYQKQKDTSEAAASVPAKKEKEKPKAKAKAKDVAQNGAASVAKSTTVTEESDATEDDNESEDESEGSEEESEEEEKPPAKKPKSGKVPK